jgi:6-pyruvoyltetrahydropterin/6-carboxytetrahydropterin synthase
MPADRYSVRISKDYLVFCCGHFITYNGDQCERLHGHNYRASVSVEGPLDENRYVFDFIALRDMTRRITDRLDHHMLVATDNKRIGCEVTASEVVLRFGDKRWVFPKEDCVLLPIESTTAELLAAWVGGQLLAELRANHRFVPSKLVVEVDEVEGQTAVYEWTPG